MPEKGTVGEAKSKETRISEIEAPVWPETDAAGVSKTAAPAGPGIGMVEAKLAHMGVAALKATARGRRARGVERRLARVGATKGRRASGGAVLVRTVR